MYINNIEDFIEHTESHINNLQHLTEYVLSEIEKSSIIRKSLDIPNGADLEYFSEKVIEGMKHHDDAKLDRKSAVSVGKHLEARIAKTMTEEIKDIKERVKIAKGLIKRGFTASDVLYAGYGENLFGMEKKAENEFFDFIKNTLNKKDNKIMSDFTQKSFNESWQVSAFKKIEEIVDKVDRGMNPISAEEFGREIAPASKFMSGENGVVKKLVESCEDNYSKVCPQNFYNKRNT